MYSLYIQNNISLVMFVKSKNQKLKLFCDLFCFNDNFSDGGKWEASRKFLSIISISSKAESNGLFSLICKALIQILIQMKKSLIRINSICSFRCFNANPYSKSFKYYPYSTPGYQKVRKTHFSLKQFESAIYF